MMKDIERSSLQLTPQQNQLIEDHYEFVIADALSMNVSKWLHPHDVVDIAQEALIAAAIKFDPTRSTKFTTYAHRVVYHKLVDYSRREEKEFSKLKELLEDEEVPQQLDDLMRHFERSYQKDKLYDYLVHHQEDRGIKLLIHRYFFGDKVVKQSDLSKQFNLSQSHLSFLENEAKKKIKNDLLK